MSDHVALSRRSFLALVGTLASAGVVVAAAPGLAEAATGRTIATSRLGATELGLSTTTEGIGFRTAIDARLTLMERHAGLELVEQGGQAYRAWSKGRLERLERFRGIDAPPPGETWREWAITRATALESFVPMALKNPAYTHLPVDGDPGEHAQILRDRIADGVADGVFLYMDAQSSLQVNTYLERIVDSGPPIPILMSPKNVSEPALLAEWMSYWAARPEWIPYVRVAFWQEFQGDFGPDKDRSIADWQQGVNTLADAADKVGIVSVAHAETWHLHPDYVPDGGAPRLAEFITPVLHRLGGGISWSVFVFNEKPTGGNDFVRWMNEFMDGYFPYTPYGLGAYGDAVARGLGPDDPKRLARAARVKSTLADVAKTRARQSGFYALAPGPNPTRDFWDPHVAAVVREWLANR